MQRDGPAMYVCCGTDQGQVLHTMSNTSIARASVGRSIPSTPLRILDAPDLVNDYYLNLVSWGHNNVSWASVPASVALVLTAAVAVVVVIDWCYE